MVKHPRDVKRNKDLKLGSFMFIDRFVDITDVQFERAIQMVNAQFSGTYHLWNTLPPDERKAKRELCLNYLIAWQLATLYPEQAIDCAGTGGMPLTGKRAGPISVQYKNLVRQAGSGILEALTTNEYGIEALLMLESAPEMYMVYR